MIKLTKHSIALDSDSSRKSDDRGNTREPLAIVGMGCRFPGGANSPGRFWKLLVRGIDAIVDVPQDRWDMRKFYSPNPNRPGKMHARQAGFLRERIDEFDPLFFGISPREAEWLDPQQRLLLEVTYEALEDAGLSMAGLRGSDTGVFVGGFALDNKIQKMSPINRNDIDSRAATSATMAILANRVSYIFDWRGPSITIDTACSSSLVATHYACESLWNDTCTLAVTGGSNVMFRPEYPITMSKGGFLSTHSRCKAFDADAGGYVRGEGAGIVVLKRLSRARADGDRIYALIRGGGVNQDGRTEGISLPNPEAQEALIRQVYRQANIEAGDIRLVEAHGTGTKAGDPVEIAALNAVLAEGRDVHDKVFVSSVKTNIGHLEAAAGVAGLIKTALCLQHNQAVPSLHFHRPNPEIDFERTVLKVPTHVERLPGNGPVYASINSFGYGGTNAHLVLQRHDEPKEAPETPETIRLPERPLPEQFIVLSAQSESALQTLAGKYADFLSHSQADLSDIAYSINCRRSHHTHRLTLAVASKEELAQKLRAYAGNRFPGSGMADGKCLGDTHPKLVFVYTGMGPQWWAMGRELLSSSRLFRETAEECDAIFRRLAGWSILAAMEADEAASRMSETQVAQPANFVIQTGLTALWRAWGITPDAVVGHSVGEVGAVHAAGVLSLEDAILVSYHRSRLQQTRAGLGTMLAVGLGEEEALALIDGFDDISIGAINSPSTVTLSGNRETLRAVAEVLAEQEIFHRFLQVELPYHSPVMDPLEEELKACLSPLSPRKGKIPIYSTALGMHLPGERWDAGYWWQNVRRSVRFARAVQQLIQDDFGTFVQIGPHPVLTGAIQECASDAGKELISLPSLVREQPESKKLHESLGRLFAMGYSPDWRTISPPGKYIDLPGYPWQRERYWQENERAREDRLGGEGHPFLTIDLRAPYPAWEVELNELYFPYLHDHRIQGATVWPGAAYVEAAFALHERLTGETPCSLEGIEFHRMLVVDPDKIQRPRTSWHEKSRTFTVHCGQDGDRPDWQLHASGMVLSRPIGTRTTQISLKDIRNECRTVMEPDALYDRFAAHGLDYGPHFRTIEALHVGENQVLAKLRGHAGSADDTEGYLLHPTVLDGAFQSMLAAVDDAQDTVMVPVSLERATLYRTARHEVWTHVRITHKDSHRLKGDLFLLGDDGNILMEIRGLTCRAVPREIQGKDNFFYAYRWRKTESVPDHDKAPGKHHYLVFANPEPIQQAILSALAERGIGYTVVTESDGYEQVDNNHYRIRSNTPSDMASLIAALHDISPDSIGRIVYLWGLTEEHGSSPPRFDQVVEHTMPLVYLAQALSGIQPQHPITLNVVTRGSQCVMDEDLGEGLENAAPWGLGAVIGNEYPHLRCRFIDLPGGRKRPRDRTDDIRLLIDELLADNGNGIEQDVAIRDSGRYVRELSREDLEDGAQSEQKIVSTVDRGVELQLGTVGQLDSLHYRETERRPPGPLEIEIEVRASALNLKDLLKVYGQISSKALENTYFGHALGMECAGVVVAAGEEVDEFQVGMEVVMAASGGCFRSYLTPSPATTFIVPKPKGLCFEEAAAILVPYLAAHYGLSHVANLERGERVLIHNASGGVGLAAVHVARWKGAEIFATAGTEEKRDYLKTLGIEHVMHSRDLSFVGEILSLTDDEGVDVVLNAIAGEALFESFSLLAPFGRFIEIGKRDISENNGLPMAAFNRNLTFAAIDMDRILAERRPLAQRLLREIGEGFDRGYFQALPVTSFPINRTSEAFRFLSQSRHMGKVVIEMHDEEVPVVVDQNKTVIDSDGTYLITGGTSGFGLELAKWLGQKGVRQLIPVSRRGIHSDEVRDIFARLEEAGTQIYAPAMDITDAEAVAALITTIRETMPPLKGIFHGAMVLDDAWLRDLDEERFRSVMAPKVAGVLNLHEHTQDLPLDFFVSFSSISSVVGNPRQANYVAANAFLDAFAWYRRGQGLPATTINLGVLAETGVAARDQGVGELLTQTGLQAFSSREVLDGIEKILAGSPIQTGFFDVNWQQWASLNPSVAASARFRQLIGAGADTSNPKRKALADEMLVLTMEERGQHMERIVFRMVSGILRVPMDKIDREKKFGEMGIDSLMSAELRGTIRKETGIDISSVDLLNASTPAQLAGLLVEKLALPDEGDLLSRIDELSEEQVDALLETGDK
uniref:Polyketide synthase 12 n=1 Tax=Candidatus Kentrum sp. FW TaxID=2126338 RepID=A0A450TYR2_9GAMM|nr:MAG: polyketide synthase 12 [Candidatus Kentron sp. FW]